MVMKKIGVGIIGASPDRGWARTAHVPALAALPQYALRAVATTRRETADAAARAFGAPLAFDRHEDLVAHPEVELVTVAVKVPHHRELVLAALSAGKHVYCEWPLGNGLAEAEQMAAAARGAGVCAAVGLQGRASPWVNQIRALVADGYVGRVLSTSVVATGEVFGATVDRANAYLLDRPNGANLLTIQFGHFADALCYCLGEFEELGATLATQRVAVTVRETGVVIVPTTPDQVSVQGTLTSGAIASIHLRGGRSRGTNLLWEINGTEGDLLITADVGFVGITELTLRGGRGDQRAMSPIPPDARHRWVPDDVPGGSALNLAQAYALLARDIGQGTSLSAGFDTAVLRHRMLEAVQAAADSGTRQRYASVQPPETRPVGTMTTAWG